MQFGAKIDKILQERNYANLNDFNQIGDQNIIKKLLIQYGMKHPQKLICHALIRQCGFQNFFTSNFKMSDILPLAHNSKYEILSFNPIGVVRQGFQTQIVQLIGSMQKSVAQKNGTIFCSKPIPKVYQAKPIKYQKKTTSIKAQKVAQNLNQNQARIEKVKSQKTQIQINKISQKIKNMNIQSDSNQIDPKDYVIQPIKKQTKQQDYPNKSTQEQQRKNQEGKNQKFTQKTADLDLDDEQAYQLLIANQNKFKKKTQNQCVNLQKQNKQTKQIVQKKTIKNPIKVKQNQTDQKIGPRAGSQPTLFNFINKK